MLEGFAVCGECSVVDGRAIVLIVVDVNLDVIVDSSSDDDDAGLVVDGVAFGILAVTVMWRVEVCALVGPKYTGSSMSPMLRVGMLGFAWLPGPLSVVVCMAWNVDGVMVVLGILMAEDVWSGGAVG